VKAFGITVSWDDFDVDTKGGTVFDGGDFEPGVNPGFGDCWMRMVGLVEQAYPDCVVG